MGNLSKYDRLTLLDDAWGAVSDIIRDLSESELDDDILDILDVAEMALNSRRREVRSDIEAHDNAERERERRDAFVGVL